MEQMKDNNTMEIDKQGSVTKVSTCEIRGYSEMENSGRHINRDLIKEIDKQKIFLTPELNGKGMKDGRKS